MTTTIRFIFPLLHFFFGFFFPLFPSALYLYHLFSFFSSLFTIRSSSFLSFFDTPLIIIIIFIIISST